MIGLPRTLGAFLVAGMLLGLVFLLSPSPCTPIPQQKAERGSHGFRTWTGADIQSFTHEGGRMCIPEGWEAVGAEHEGPGWAAYAKERTGVIVRSAAFASVTLSVEGSEQEVAILYPVSKTRTEDIAAYETMVKDAFRNVGALFPRARIKKDHTVLVTAGLGRTRSEDGSVYPDPGPGATFLILPPEDPRAEELLLHAVVHLYNRFTAPPPAAFADEGIPASDREEIEASWAETAFESSPVRRAARIDYLYTVHRAVANKDFSLIHEAPFNDEAEFTALRPGVVLPKDATYMEEQYGHYVLAPLMMTAVEALLQKYAPGTDVGALIARTNSMPGAEFFAELARLLPAEEMQRVRRFMNGEEAIPWELVAEGMRYYDTR